MPRNYRQVERTAKEREIVVLAARQLREGGCGALSVAAIARQLKRSPNSIYWYFPSRDELLVAAARELVAGAWSGKPPSGGLERQAMWFTELLYGLDDLRRELYGLARDSAIVAAYVEELDAQQHRLIHHALQGNLPGDELALATDVIQATLDGAALRNLPLPQRRALIRSVLERLGALH